MSSISNSQRKLLRQLQTRQGRKKNPFFVVEGVRCCHEAVARRPAWIEFAVAADDCADAAIDAVNPLRVSSAEFADLSQTENPQGMMLVMRRPISDLAETVDACIVVLDQVSDPGNIGTILRTAWAVNLKTVIWTTGGCDPFSPKAIRAGMGAQFALDLPVVGSTDELAGVFPERRIWLTDVRKGTSCYAAEFDLSNSLLILGNEAHGAQQLSGAGLVHIPMPGKSESLNVAQAGTVLLFEGVRRGLFR